MLFQFTPVTGPSVGAGAYTLPAIQDGDTRRAGLISSEMAHMAGTPGSYDGMGTDATDTDVATIDCTFYLSDNWLLSRSYTANFAGREHAIRDFVKAVAMGGLGTLTDQWTDTGSITRTVSTKARCVALETSRSAVSTWTITVTFEIPSGFWTDYDGSLLLVS